MKLFISTLTFFTLLTSNCIAQYVLKTPDGKTVKLFSNGKWEYIKENEQKNKTPMPVGSTEKYTSRFKKYQVWYNPAEWFYDTTKKADVYTWDAIFYSKDYAIQGYCIESRLSFPPELIEESIKQQWESSGKITSFKKYNDTINNLPFTFFEMELNYNNINYYYKGLLHTFSRGSFQITLGTQKEIFEEDKNKIDLLLRGIVRIEE